jgi:hypothetical protein
MRKIQETLQAQSTTTQDIMYIAFELSNSTWRLADILNFIEEILKEN